MNKKIILIWLIIAISRVYSFFYFQDQVSVENIALGNSTINIKGNYMASLQNPSYLISAKKNILGVSFVSPSLDIENASMGYNGLGYNFSLKNYGLGAGLSYIISFSPSVNQSIFSFGLGLNLYDLFVKRVNLLSSFSFLKNVVFAGNIISYAWSTESVSINNEKIEDSKSKRFFDYNLSFLISLTKNISVSAVFKNLNNSQVTETEKLDFYYTYGILYDNNKFKISLELENKEYQVFHLGFGNKYTILIGKKYLYLNLRSGLYNMNLFQGFMFSAGVGLVNIFGTGFDLNYAWQRPLSKIGINTHCVDLVYKF